ncbi:hypothetical protein GGR58DRAFT_526951 [Xylaria digitata]|nr:hypothetical protein GGR58DRAFT_526951 [Xylaria digitata]
MTSIQPLPPVYTAQNKLPKSPEKTLRRYRSTFIFTFFFLFLLIAPWVFLSVLNVRPIGGKRRVGSWQDVSGYIHESVVQTSEQIYRAATVLTTLTAVLTLPLLSKLFDHAAVVFVQRRHPDQHLNASQTLSLADAPWSRPLSFTRGVSGISYGAIALVAIAYIQLILQSALVTWDEVRVATFLDTPNPDDYPYGYYDQRRYTQLGYDPTPEPISKVPVALVIKEVAARMSTESSKGPQPRLWSDGHNQFASAFPSTTNTGVLRYHAMRFNTSVHCETVSADRFPETCPGLNPLYGSVSLPPDNRSSTTNRANVTIRWCVPINPSSPWSSSRDRQDIAEDMYVDVSLSNGMHTSSITESFTTHCWANTTRGYFELPNYHNNFTTGPLVKNWTSPSEYSATTNDPPDDDRESNYFSWPYSSGYPDGNYEELTPGPLATAMKAMLGSDSWIVPVQNISATTDNYTLSLIYRDMCTGGIPFLSWDSSSGFSQNERSCYIYRYAEDIERLPYIRQQVYGWFNSFSLSEYPNVNDTLASAAFFANEATLTRAAVRPYWYNAPGVIYSSPGATVHKPNISLPAEIVISILIGAEALAIIALLAFIYRKPTFTNRLDALVVATIGAQLAAAGVELPHLNETGSKWHKILEAHDGVIGFNHGDLADEETRDTSGQNGTTNGQGGTSSSNNIELRNMDEPAPSRILIVGGIGSL